MLLELKNAPPDVKVDGLASSPIVGFKWLLLFSPSAPKDKGRCTSLPQSVLKHAQDAVLTPEPTSLLKNIRNAGATS